jgi:D-3-phosphoglycerate dehydrogenase
MCSMTDLMALQQVLRSRPRIVATADLTPEGIEALERIGPVTCLGWAAGEWFVEPERLSAALADAQVLIAGYEQIDRQVLNVAPNLRIIASVRGAPAANIDIEAATERGIPVLHTVARTDHGVAEFTLALALALTRHLVPAAGWITGRPTDFDAGEEPYRSTVWGHAATSPQLAFTGYELHGRRLGIVGFGGIGRVVAQKFSGLGMQILVHDPFLAPDVIAAAGAVPVTLDELLPQSAIVTLHARLSASTRGMIGAHELRLMQPSSYLINTGRAGLIDPDALLAALDSGQIAGAALDVFDSEPPSANDRLAAHPKVLATPHLAAWTVEMQQRHTASIVGNLERLRDGGVQINITNPEVLSQGQPNADR